MQYNLHASLITHLRTTTEMPVIWHQSGMKLPSENPFITIEQMPNNNEILSKQRESIQTTFRFQIGLFASSGSTRSRQQSAISRILLYDKIPYTDYAQLPTQVVGFFICNVTAEVPFNADAIEELTRYHRVYFDVEIPSENITRK